MKSDNVICLGEYEMFRELCHGVKCGNALAINNAVKLLLEITPSNATLVPIPSHFGTATYTLEIANKIAMIKGCSVYPCIVSPERGRMYDAKKLGKSINLNFVLKNTPSGNIFLFDNCIDTGATYDAATRLIGVVPIITIAKTNHYGK